MKSIVPAKTTALKDPGITRTHDLREAWISAFILFSGAFLLYFATRSPGLDEVDSGNFVFGVRSFNLWQHQPHPPGYPLYIFLGRLGCSLTGITPELALQVVSAIGGGLLIAAWFLIIWLQFDKRLAWWVATCLLITPVIWMTATKILSDSLAAGLLSTEILAAICFKRTGSRRTLLAMALCGAAAAGTRPQLILVVFTVLATGLIAGPSIPRKWAILTWACLIFACLCWLLPMWYIQSRLQPDVAAGSVYPHLVYKFWAGRLDKPQMYLFAAPWTVRYIALRCAFHFLGWFGVGFGFLQSWIALGLGTIISLLGVGAYTFSRKESADGQFWRFHLPWAIVHIAAIFISLPATQRYYVIIFPLLLVLLLRGLLRLSRPWNLAAYALPAVLLVTAIPIAAANHRDEAPPTRFVRYLQQLYPVNQRGRVVLLLSTRTGRNAQWYSSEFRIVSPIPPPESIPEATRAAVAVYTDDPWAPLPAGWYRVPLSAFTRSVIIYWKDHYLELYLVDRQNREL